MPLFFRKILKNFDRKEFFSIFGPYFWEKMGLGKNGSIRSLFTPTSNPGPFDIEAAREKALVKSGHVTPQILDIA